jgi:hypothetical protein
MSRSGYSDDGDQWSLICWRGAVASATKGARGQQLLRELLAALDAMPLPDRRLIEHDLVRDGQFCALGVLGAKQGKTDAMAAIDPEDYDAVAKLFGVAPALVREIEWVNDEGNFWHDETDEKRWSRMRDWVASLIKPEAA